MSVRGSRISMNLGQSLISILIKQAKQVDGTSVFDLAGFDPGKVARSHACDEKRSACRSKCVIPGGWPPLP